MPAPFSERSLQMLVARLRAAGTDIQQREVKACANGLTRDIARTLSGFSNGAGGVLVCGLDENRGFAPAEGFDPKRIQDALARTCSDELTPPVRPLVDMVLFEGAPVLVVTVEEMRPRDKPCYVTAQGRYSGSYIRVGDGDRRLSPYEVDRLLDEHRQPRYDRQVVECASLGDLDSDLVADLLRRERYVHTRSFSQLDDATALRKLGVIARDEQGVDRPTLAGLVALGSYPQEFFPSLTITFASYPTWVKGETTADGRRFLDSCTCVGSAPAMVEDALIAVARNIRTGARVEGAYRYGVPDYPPEALREALVNAVMHRDYSPEALGTPVMVELFPDRIEIRNPGGLYGVVTVDALGAGEAVSRRNECLANLLESTPRIGGGYVAENRGSGYRTIELELERAGLPEPVPRNSIALFTLVLYGPNGIAPARGVRGVETVSIPCAYASSGRVRVEQGGPYDVKTLLGKTEQSVLEQVRAADTVSTSELVERTGRSRPTVLKALRHLLERGLIATEGGAKNSPRMRYRAL